MNFKIQAKQAYLTERLEVLVDQRSELKSTPGGSGRIHKAAHPTASATPSTKGTYRFLNSGDRYKLNSASLSPNPSFTCLVCTTKFSNELARV